MEEEPYSVSRIRRRMNKHHADMGMWTGMSNGFILVSVMLIVVGAYHLILPFMMGLMICLGCLLLFQGKTTMNFLKQIFGVTENRMRIDALAKFFKLDYFFIPAHGEYKKQKKLNKKTT